MTYRVLMFRVLFKYELEHCQRDVMAIGKAIKRHLRPAMHSKRGIAFVIVTDETSTELMDRVGPTLAGIGAIENYWCHTAATDIAAMNGDMDPLVTFTRDAYAEARKRNHAKNVPKPERRKFGDIWGVKHRVSGAPVEMGVPRNGMRDSPKNPDRQ